ncbi:MAG TPA: hypothetical protein V6C85_20430, partial [Allocoleopsis sp.]
MNQMLRGQGLLEAQNLQDGCSSLPDILTLLRLSPVDPTMNSQFNQAFELYQVQLGDRLDEYYESSPSGKSVHGKLDEPNL